MFSQMENGIKITIREVEQQIINNNGCCAVRLLVASLYFTGSLQLRKHFVYLQQSRTRNPHSVHNIVVILKHILNYLYSYKKLMQCLYSISNKHMRHNMEEKMCLISELDLTDLTQSYREARVCH